MEQVGFVVDRVLLKIKAQYHKAMVNELNSPSVEQVQYEKEMSHTLGTAMPEKSATQNTSI